MRKDKLGVSPPKGGSRGIPHSRANGKQHPVITARAFDRLRRHAGLRPARAAARAGIALQTLVRIGEGRSDPIAGSVSLMRFAVDQGAEA